MNGPGYPARFAARSGFFVAAVALALSALFAPFAAGAEMGRPGPDPATLTVIYAGNPGSDREKDFVALLRKHFKEVATGDYRSFGPDDAKGFDIVILDWTTIFARDEQGKIDMSATAETPRPKAPEITREFGRPVVMIGSAAGTLSLKLQTAINWKCLCLQDRAHDVETEHPIFEGPLAVELKFEQQEKPFDYWAHPGTRKLGETLQVWKVQEKTFPEIDPGLVSTRDTFAACSDAEVISGGINSKGPDSVAIGRHGNFLLWGFSGQPSDMTDSARAAFVNAVCYMKQFDGQIPQQAPQPDYSGRDAFLERIYSMRMLSDEYVAKQADNYREMLKEHPPAEELRKEIGDDFAAYYLKSVAPHIEPVRENLPKEIRERFAGDDEALIQYYTDNLEYLRAAGEDQFVVDEDVRSLGVSNRSRELLEKCVALLETGEKTDVARRVLTRYTDQTHDDVEAWRQWLDAGGDSFRFADSTGKFFLVP